MPILTLVIPQLKNDGMRFQLVGRGVARQCQIQRGLLPVLAAPSPSGNPSAFFSMHALLVKDRCFNVPWLLGCWKIHSQIFSCVSACDVDVPSKVPLDSRLWVN